MAGPEFEGFGKVGDAAAEVAEFVDCGWAWSMKGLVRSVKVFGMISWGIADLSACVGICCLGGASLLAEQRYHGQS